MAYDGKLQSNVATVSLTIAPVILPLTTTDGSFTMQEDDQLVVPAPGILGSASIRRACRSTPSSSTRRSTAAWR